MLSRPQQSDDVVHVVDGLGRVLGFQGFQGHPMMHFHRSSLSHDFLMLVAVALLQVDDEAGYRLQFFIGNLFQAEGRHLKSGVSDLVLDHLLVVSRQRGGDGGAFGVLPMAGGASLGDEQGMAGRISNCYGGRGRCGRFGWRPTGIPLVPG